MKRLFLTTALCLAIFPLASNGLLVGAAALSGQTSQTPRLENAAVVIPHDQIQKLLAQISPGAKIFSGGLLDAEHFRVGVTRREAPGQVEIHRDDNDIFYMLAGSATIVTGGTAVNPKKTSEKETIAESIQNGVSHQVHAGDVVVIPKQQPHWFQKLTAGTEYLVVKVQ